MSTKRKQRRECKYKCISVIYMFFSFDLFHFFKVSSYNIQIESWIITGECDTGVSAIIEDAFMQYQRTEFQKLKPYQENRDDVFCNEQSDTPKLRLVMVVDSHMTRNDITKVG